MIEEDETSNAGSSDTTRITCVGSRGMVENNGLRGILKVRLPLAEPTAFPAPLEKDFVPLERNWRV